MSKFDRIHLVVMDSVGIGAAPDADEFFNHDVDDTKSDTFGHISENFKLEVPNLASIGLGQIPRETPLVGVEKVSKQTGYVTKLEEISRGKDTMTGHWEIMGLNIQVPFRVFPDGYPEDLLEKIEAFSGRKVIREANIPYSGTAVIDDFGPRQMETGELIIYTSADPVLQIAAHEDVIPLEELYKICEYVRSITLDDPYMIGRIIARPYIGTPGNFTRTAGRHDYALSPFGHTVLDSLNEAGVSVYSVGKINDIFNGVGINHDMGHTPSNMVGVDRLIETLDRLIQFHNVDFQWGNHDVLWMGAYAGNLACLATLLRIAVKYNYLYELEAAYGLNLRPLFLFAEAHYTDNNSGFTPASRADDELYGVENQTRLSQVHQALSIIQFKLEGQIISRRPDFEMADRNLLERIDYDQQTINLSGQTYTLKNACFQTISPELPNQLTDGETYVMTAILDFLQTSEKFQRHMHFLVEKGSAYLVYNRHLLYHGCIPLKDDGSFLEMKIEEASYSGRALLDQFDAHIRRGIHYPDIRDDYSTDLMWYAWAGKCSPLFGRSSMTTFERYFIADKKTHQEGDNAYFTYREDPKMMTKILAEFGLTDHQSVVINGHTPVKVGDGESPIKAAGKLMVIDGGMSKAYQKTTGIAGYSLLNDSDGFKIVTSHD